MHINWFNPFRAEIFSSGQVHIWTRCKIVGPDNFSYRCSCCSFLCLCCQKTNRWLSWSLGDNHNGSCCCVHNLCETLSFIHKSIQFFPFILHCSTALIRHFVYKHEKHFSILQLTKNFLCSKLEAGISMNFWMKYNLADTLYFSG